MNKNSHNQLDDNYIEQIVQPIFGYSNDQLILEFDCANAQQDDLQLVTPNDEFRKLLLRIKKVEEEERNRHKVVKLNRVVKPLLLAAALGTIVMVSGIGASGSRAFEYWDRELNDDKSSLIWNNNESNLGKGKRSEEAYQRIKDELGIKVLYLEYLPPGFEFIELSILKGQARMQFQYKNSYLNLYQTLYNVENSLGSSSDCNIYKEVYNNWLKEDVSVEKKVLEDGSVEFTTTVKGDKVLYLLSGVIEEDEFTKIVERMKIKEYS